MKLLVSDRMNDNNFIIGFEPNGKISVQVGDNIAEISFAEWKKINSFMVAEHYEAEDKIKKENNPIRSWFCL